METLDFIMKSCLLDLSGERASKKSSLGDERASSGQSVTEPYNVPAGEHLDLGWLNNTQLK